MNASQPGQVVAVCRSAGHEFSKVVQPSVGLIAGLGIEGDAHSGVKVQHRSRVAADPEQPNLRQVHLLHAELFEELAAKGFDVQAGQLGENITTQGLELLALPTGTRLTIGAAVIELTGLRNPCGQIENFRPGLLSAVLDRDGAGRLVRKAGVMGVVLPPQPSVALERV
jgi:MOSC domain-containing protein YiiM